MVTDDVSLLVLQMVSAYILFADLAVTGMAERARMLSALCISLASWDSYNFSFQFVNFSVCRYRPMLLYVCTTSSSGYIPTLQVCIVHEFGHRFIVRTRKDT